MRRGRSVVPHLVAGVGFLLLVGTWEAQGSALRDARLHALGLTVIVHETGEVVVRLPSDRLVHTDVFESVDARAIYAGCSLCLAGWVAWLVYTGVLQLRRRPRERRGFPIGP